MRAGFRNGLLQRSAWRILRTRHTKHHSVFPERVWNVLKASAGRVAAVTNPHQHNDGDLIQHWKQRNFCRGRTLSAALRKLLDEL